MNWLKLFIIATLLVLWASLQTAIWTIDEAPVEAQKNKLACNEIFR